MNAKPFAPLVGPTRSRADALAELIEAAVRRLGDAGILVDDRPERRAFRPLSAEKRAAIVAEYQARVARGGRVSLVVLARDSHVHVNTVRKLTRHFRLSKPLPRKRATR